ncbi:MAG: protein kinase [Polyangiaceae bacterium]|nr:protein kinase [Polyangiaceae bacterium]
MSRSSTPPARGAFAAGDKYRLCSRLGGGGQAEVYLALASGPLGFSKLVVLKKLRPEMLEQPELVSMFMDEARLAARLNHPNIVHTYEVGAGDDYFIAMEYLEGQSLSRLRNSPEAPSLSPATWARVAADALGGLHYAHELCDFDGSPLGIVHRDVSPQNIFVTYDGVIKLVDFGVAKAALNSVRTATGAIKGKASYMAPEQVMGLADRRSDVFSMGVVLWEAFAGRKLFTGEVVSILHRVLNEPIPLVSSLVPAIDPRLDAIVARAVEKNADARYQTAQEMRGALEAYLADSGQAVRSEDVGRWLHNAFADERERTRKQVQAVTEGSATYDVGAHLPSLANTLTLTPRVLTPSGVPPPSYVEIPSSASASQLGILVDRSTMKPRGPRPPAARLLIGLGALGALATGTFVLLSRPVAPAAPPLATAATTPTASPTTPAAPGAALEIRSNPTGANVSWNGKPLGTTPLKLELPLGAYTLLLAKEGYQTEALVTELPKAGALVSHSVALRPSTPSPVAPAVPATPPPAIARPGRPPAGAGRRPPPAPTAVSTPAPTPSPPRPKIQVVGNEAPKKINVIE